MSSATREPAAREELTRKHSGPPSVDLTVMDFPRATSSQPMEASTVAPSDSVSRAEREQELRDAFREQQRQRKAQQVHNLVLGKGLGEAAEETLVDGYYNPQQVLPPPAEEAKQLWDPIDLHGLPWKGTAAGTTSLEDDGASEQQTKVTAADTREGDGMGEPPQTLMEKLRSTYSPVQAIRQVSAEMNGNVDVAEEELNAMCSPFTFNELLASLRTALDSLEDGDAEATVVLPAHSRALATPRPTARGEPLTLVGPAEVLAYVRAELLGVAYALVPLTHTSQWVAQYTVAFLRSLAAVNEEEAQVRLELLARCVRLVGRTEGFSSVLLLLESKLEEYEAFNSLRDGAEEHIGALLDDVQAMLDAVLGLPFPTRRARLRLMESGIQQKLQRALLFLNEIDYNWTPNVKSHAVWKEAFLRDSFYRVHRIISPRFAQCLMGFVDDALYKLVSDSRVSGKLVGAASTQPQVPVARQVEYERVTDGLTFQQIGMRVKGSASIVVGTQVCMGARFVLRQSTADFNEQWGFVMNEKPETVDKTKVNAFVATVTAKARRRLVKDSAPHGKPPRRRAGSDTEGGTTFLTQGDI